MRKKFVKNIVTGTAAIAIVVAALVPTPAMANNHTDSGFFYQTGTRSKANSGYVADARPKEDSSSSYMYCTACEDITTGKSSNGTFKAVVHGSKTKTGTYANMITSSGKASTTYVFSVGREVKMSNYVYECGGKYARIWAFDYGTNSLNLLFRGKWSPDSV
jgi:hypothetical protein